MKGIESEGRGGPARIEQRALHGLQGEEAARVNLESGGLVRRPGAEEMVLEEKGSTVPG